MVTKSPESVVISSSGTAFGAANKCSAANDDVSRESTRVSDSSMAPASSMCFCTRENTLPMSTGTCIRLCVLARTNGLSRK
ncbi:hypothetical protein D9M69_734580 [compost metagenome]